MGRPPKFTADWFTHDANASDGRTLTIIEGRFGLEGYAVWFKLLERLAASRQHVICCNRPGDIEFLAGKWRLSPENLAAILDKLAELDAIDRQLWSERRTIWCQHMVDRFAGLYADRHQALPEKPTVMVSPPVNPVSNPLNPVSNRISAGKPDFTGSKSHTEITEIIDREGPPPIVPQKTTAAAATIKDSLGEIATIYEQNFGLLNPLIGDKLKDMLAEYGETLTRDALTEAGTQPANKRHINYVAAILKRWAAEGRGPLGNNGHGQQPPKGKTRVPARYTRPEELDAEDGLTGKTHGGSTARDRAPPVAV